MEDYLEKLGFSPQEMGLKLKSTAPAESATPPEEPTNSFCDTPLKELPLTMAYVPLQQNFESYDPAMALNTGTLFPALNKPLTLKRN